MSAAPLEPVGPAVPRTRWPLERVLFALAGSMTLLSAALAALVSPWFLVLTALVGANQWLFAVFGACPASLILRRAFSLPSVLYPSAETPRGRERSRPVCAAAAQRLAVSRPVSTKPRTSDRSEPT
jgi:hypothetical protein